MKSLKYSVGIFLLFMFSCTPEPKLEGVFQNSKDGSRTIIEKKSANEYQVSAAFNPELTFPATREGNTLKGNFKGKSITIEYENSYNTIINKSEDKILFSADRTTNP